MALPLVGEGPVGRIAESLSMSPLGGSTMIPIKTILHPTDFSKPSECALRFACALARDSDARPPPLHVGEPPVYYGELGMTVPPPADFHESLQERLEHLVPADAG